MWARLDDELLDHEKISTAGEVIGGRNGSVIALGFYAQCLMWANRHLSDGHLPQRVVKGFRHGSNPLSIADALVKAGLLEKNGNGFVIHDFTEFNPVGGQGEGETAEGQAAQEGERDAREPPIVSGTAFCRPWRCPQWTRRGKVGFRARARA